MTDRRITRREMAVVAGAAVALARAVPARGQATWTRTLDFGSAGTGEGWPGWACTGVANLLRRDGQGVLEAGSDVFPCDPRPVAFAVDQRFRDGEIAAQLTAGGAGAGLVVRRVAPREYYAAVLDDEAGALVIVRRSPTGVEELARVDSGSARPPLRLTFAASGAAPTVLTATAGEVVVSARDSTPGLQRAGDAGVLATARTLWPHEGPEAMPALGNVHLLPYGVQEGQAVMETAVGEEVLARIRERSTAAFTSIAISASGSPQPTVPSVVAATSGPPLRRGGRVRVATDVPALVEVEFALNPSFRRSRRVRARTGSFDSVLVGIGRLRPGRRVWWRARVRRRGRTVVGPTRSFRVLAPAGEHGPASVAVASCAAQFGPIFGELAGRRPDVLVWQGDLNYPDTAGPLAQTTTGYAGFWRDLLANPALAELFAATAFAPQRDDHDYGLQDANSTNLVPWGLAPWDALMETRPYYRFAAGLAEYWVLDQRLFKTDPKLADGPDKTLLGGAQRDWLLRTLAASRAPFKVVCSPCTLAPLPANRRDGSWADGFTSERDLILRHVRERVGGQTLFVTGDTHWTMAYDRDGLFEARPCPLCIPAPNDITLTQPQVAEDARRVPGVLYADDERGHFALIESRAARAAAHLTLTFVREDGAEVFSREFEQPLPAARPRRRSRRIRRRRHG